MININRIIILCQSFEGPYLEQDGMRGTGIEVLGKDSSHHNHKHNLPGLSMLKNSKEKPHHALYCSLLSGVIHKQVFMLTFLTFQCASFLPSGIEGLFGKRILFPPVFFPSFIQTIHILLNPLASKLRITKI